MHWGCPSFVIYPTGGVWSSINPAVSRIRLTRKLALTMNGVDVSSLQVGDIVDLPAHQADMMVACSWAERVADDNAFPHSHRPLTNLTPGTN